MDYFKDKVICKECKYYEETAPFIGNIGYAKCNFKPLNVKKILYVDGEVLYEDNCYRLNKDGGCKNYLPMDFEKRLDYIFDKCFKDIEKERQEIVHNAKIKFLDKVYGYYWGFRIPSTELLYSIRELSINENIVSSERRYQRRKTYMESGTLNA